MHQASSLQLKVEETTIILPIIQNPNKDFDFFAWKMLTYLILTLPIDYSSDSLWREALSGNVRIFGA